MACSIAADEAGDSRDAKFSTVPWLRGEFASADDGETGVMRTTREFPGLDA